MSSMNEMARPFSTLFKGSMGQHSWSPLAQSKGRTCFFSRSATSASVKLARSQDGNLLPLPGYLEVLQPRGELEQEALVVREIPGHVHVVAGECLHVLERVPERDHAELGLVTVQSPNHHHALVAGGLLELGDPAFLQVRE